MRAFAFALIVFVAFLLIAPPTLAQMERGEASSEYDFGSSGFYVWLGGATGIDMAAEEEATRLAAAAGMPAGSKIDIKNAFGFNGKIGVRASPHWATEAQFEYLPSFDWVVSAGTATVTAAQVRMITLTANIKLFMLTGRIQPFALLGAGGVFSEITSPIATGSGSASGLAVRGGGGVDIYLAEHIAASADVSYVFPAGDTRHLDYLSIGWGLQYKF